MSGCPLEEMSQQGEGGGEQEKMWFCHFMSHEFGTALQG